MKTLLKKEVLLLLVLAAPFVFLAVVWPQIPDRVPIHFDTAITPDGWMSKAAGMLLLPCTALVLALFTRIWFHYDPKVAKLDEGARANVERVFRQAMMATALLLSATSISLIWAAWGNFQVLARTLDYGIPLLCLVLGNGMGKLRPNYTIGIRLPWTLESSVVWQKTHRFGGRLLVASSLALIAARLLGLPQSLYTLSLVAVLLVCVVAVVIYSFVQSRKSDAGAVGTTVA